MSALEDEVAALREKLVELTERVRLTATAERFLAGDHEIKRGDYFVKWGAHGGGDEPSRLSYITSDGKWCYGNTEYGDRDQQRKHARLYTIAEVAEIIALAQRGGTP